MAYIIMFGISVSMLSVAERYRKRCDKNAFMFFLILGLLMPCILAGIRDFSVGNDVLLYGNYWFETAVKSDSIVSYIDYAVRSDLGAGYAVLNWIISRITHNLHMYYFLFELFQITILYFVIKEYKEKLNISFVFLTYYFLFYNESLNILRQIIAVLLVLYSYKYIKNKKVTKFILTIILAFTFHSSSLVGVVLYPLDWAMKSKLKKMYTGGILIVSLIVMVGYQHVFALLSNWGLLSSERYIKYFSNDLVGGRMVRLLFWGIVISTLIWKRKKSIKYMNEGRTLILYAGLSFIMTLLTFISSAWIIRIAYYFDIFIIFQLPLLAKVLPFRIKNQNGNYLIITIFLFVYWIFNIVIRNNGGTYPFIFMTN
ncbi:MAG: EpsG family protein [Clostridium butyricum]|nr:EpsG family protein [Clostridium butyricum]